VRYAAHSPWPPAPALCDGRNGHIFRRVEAAIPIVLVKQELLGATRPRQRVNDPDNPASPLDLNPKQILDKYQLLPKQIL
jgi:hypothetical protein